jgi:hypothetical protein
MNKMLNIASIATKEITQFLNSLTQTINVENVENVPEYQKKDIDILWSYDSQNPIIKTIEIKADTYHNTGNYFIETVSNTQKKTLGCFMYTEADYIYYYFVNEKILHILPMPEMRYWFIENEKRFPLKSTGTRVGNNAYFSEGRTVPRYIPQRELESGIEIIDLKSKIGVDNI